MNRKGCTQLSLQMRHVNSHARNRALLQRADGERIEILVAELLQGLQARQRRPAGSVSVGQQKRGNIRSVGRSEEAQVVSTKVVLEASEAGQSGSLARCAQRPAKAA